MESKSIRTLSYLLKKRISQTADCFRNGVDLWQVTVEQAADESTSLNFQANTTPREMEERMPFSVINSNVGSAQHPLRLVDALISL